MDIQAIGTVFGRIALGALICGGLLHMRAAEAQLLTGETFAWRLDTAGEQIGTMLATAALPASGFAANSEYWDWDGGSWPESDFLVVHDSSATVDSSADYTDDADFPATADTQLPESIGSNDLMYAISVCSSPRSCTGAGYLWVEDDGATLHWYLRSDWSGDRILSGTSKRAHFDHLTAAPNNNNDFRYLELDRQ